MACRPGEVEDARGSEQTDDGAVDRERLTGEPFKRVPHEIAPLFFARRRIAARASDARRAAMLSHGRLRVFGREDNDPVIWLNMVVWYIW